MQEADSNDLVQAFEEPPPSSLDIISPQKNNFYQPPKLFSPPGGHSIKQFSKDKIKFVKPITNGPP
jgi:hypothetical protein